MARTTIVARIPPTTGPTLEEPPEECAEEGTVPAGVDVDEGSRSVVLGVKVAVVMRVLVVTAAEVVEVAVGVTTMGGVDVLVIVTCETDVGVAVSVSVMMADVAATLVLICTLRSRAKMSHQGNKRN